VRHIKMLGLCLIAVLAVVAAVATSASALPEFGQCYAKTGGKYSEANCQKAAKGGTGTYEWRKATQIEGEKRHFVGTAGAGVLESKFVECKPSERRKAKCAEGETEETLKATVECESERNHGEISGAKTISHVAVVFRGCKALGSISCSNSGTAGEVIVNALKGTLGYINKSKKEVGVLLEPAVKKSEFAKFVCGPLGIVVGEGNSAEGCAYPMKACGGDGIIGVYSPVNVSTSSFTQTFASNEETAENIPDRLQGKPLTALESYLYNPEKPEGGSLWSKASESLTNTATLCAHEYENSENPAECAFGETETGEIKA
jgi:hypothetical protein